jgi:uncharacterized LabA/DUF88 family protein
MKRVCLFFDGRNFHAGMKSANIHGRNIDMARFANWVVENVAGKDGILWGAHYYTSETTAISAFLESLETTTGYFVHRKNRKSQYTTCQHCNNRIEYTTEKEVDTQLVADIVRMAAVDGYDEMVLMSGDSDHTPCLDAAAAFGKRTWVGLWGSYGANSRVVTKSFGRVDLLDGLDAFSIQGYEHLDVEDDGQTNYIDSDGEPLQMLDLHPDPDTNQGLNMLIREVHRAYEHFTKQGGYLGVSYFITRWKSANLPRGAAERETLLDMSLEKNLVAIETMPNGAKALKPLV